MRVPFKVPLKFFKGSIYGARRFTGLEVRNLGLGLTGSE